MTTTSRTQPVSLDTLTLDMVPVVLGGPSLRRGGEHRRPLLRPTAPADRPALQTSAQDRLSTPR